MSLNAFLGSVCDIYIYIMGLVWIIDVFSLMVYTSGLIYVYTDNITNIVIITIITWIIIITDFTENGDDAKMFLALEIVCLLVAWLLYTVYTFGSIFDDQFVFYIFLPLNIFAWWYYILYYCSD